MKRFFSLFILFIFLFSFSLIGFSFNIDGKNTGVEWDGATVYKLVDGESNCRVDFAVVKFKFDYETDALYMCFLFSDPDFTFDNINAGVSLVVEDASAFEVTASDSLCSENILPYSFDGAVFVDKNHGATCEIRVGFKSGLPETIACDVRFIDSQGFYSNHYQFVVVNENYQITQENTINPTEDNTDPAYNPDYNEVLRTDNRTKKIKTTKSTTSKKRTTKKSTTKVEKTTSKISKQTKHMTSTEEDAYNVLTATTAKVKKTQKETVKVIYYEKEIYISEVYVSITNEISSFDSVSNEIPSTELSLSEKTESDTPVSLSDGTKYKKIVTAAGLAAFIILACIGTYSAQKSSDKSAE